MRSRAPIEQHYTITQVCQLLGISRATLWRLEHSGALVPRQLPTGGKRYAASAINRMLYSPPEVRA